MLIATQRLTPKISERASKRVVSDRESVEIHQSIPGEARLARPLHFVVRHLFFIDHLRYKIHRKQSRFH